VSSEANNATAASAASLEPGNDYCDASLEHRNFNSKQDGDSESQSQ
jgi:hypothetical protein